ncbi:hypothetical protein [Halomonas organivorans]|uniref:DUF4124 domain-containing protein n=1 Tax=Halomonas organivorans TaxID=257772 RepID=A0A7W5BYV0_9GAMM|nr:hypothetical protein [Halomonas organivorans]MBB3140713.1 hypothetical protein [Halomonas organivorans]
MSRRTPTTLLCLILLATLAGCTTYTWPDGHRETVWGVPAQDDTKSDEQRRAEGVQYRQPGEVPE